MRQLDLFSSLFDTPPQETKGEEIKPVSERKEEKPVAKPEQAPYSLVELAEEAFASDNINSANNIRTLKPVERSEVDSVLFLEETKDVFEIDQNVSVQEKVDVEDLGEQPQKEVIHQAQSAKNGTVVFDDGRISVKVKTKALVVVPAVDIPIEKVEEKVKKEPQKRGRKAIKEIEAEADLIEVPEDEELFQKQYYPISEVAKWFRVNTSLLRFWENEFDILKPRKNRKGDRLFRPEDVKSLQLIYQLLRQRKYTIEGAKDYIKTNKKKADIEMQLANSLQKFKSFLLDLKANL